MIGPNIAPSVATDAWAIEIRTTASGKVSSRAATSSALASPWRARTLSPAATLNAASVRALASARGGWIRSSYRSDDLNPLLGQARYDADAAYVGAHGGLGYDWALSDDGHFVSKSFRFRDFHRCMAFVNAVAWIAHVEDHHPDMEVGYGHGLIRFNTHDVGGLSENDFICAAKVEALNVERAP